VTVIDFSVDLVQSGGMAIGAGLEGMDMDIVCGVCGHVLEQAPGERAVRHGVLGRECVGRDVPVMRRDDWEAWRAAPVDPWEL
jgi:hypothetical protein